MSILAAVDGERETDRVVTVGDDLASAHGEELVVCHVMESDEFAARQDETPDYYLRDAEETARNTARRVAQGTLPDVEGVEFAGAVGDPAETIREEAMDREASYLVVGGRARSPIEEAVFGSVTREILLGADRPVVTVQSGD